MELLYGEHYTFRGNALDFADDLCKFTQKIYVQMNDNLENAVVEQIIKTAKEEGITDVIILNKKAIIEALKKRIAEKVIPRGKYRFMCPFCKEELGIEREDISVYDMTPPKNCENCGQALAWE